jgi:hypothetical protein
MPSATDLLGWDGKRLSAEDFRQLQKRLPSYWHPDQRAAFISTTGRRGEEFDETSAKVRAALAFFAEHHTARDIVRW